MCLCVLFFPSVYFIFFFTFMPITQCPKMPTVSILGVKCDCVHETLIRILCKFKVSQITFVVLLLVLDLFFDFRGFFDVQFFVCFAEVYYNDSPFRQVIIFLYH